MLTTLLILTGTGQAMTPIAPPKPTAEQRALYDALKVRDAAPPCETLEPLSENVAADLVWLVDNAAQPPWVGIRAAQCVLSNHLEAQVEAIDSWVVHPDKRGLALLTLGLMDDIPEAAAVRFATLALDGPFAEDARSRLIDSVHPTVANMAKAPEAEPPAQIETASEATPEVESDQAPAGSGAQE